MSRTSGVGRRPGLLLQVRQMSTVALTVLGEELTGGTDPWDQWVE